MILLLTEILYFSLYYAVSEEEHKKTFNCYCFNSYCIFNQIENEMNVKMNVKVNVEVMIVHKIISVMFTQNNSNINKD